MIQIYCVGCLHNTLWNGNFSARKTELESDIIGTFQLCLLNKDQIVNYGQCIYLCRWPTAHKLADMANKNTLICGISVI